MPRYTKDNTLLFDPLGKPIVDHFGHYNPHSMAASLYFNPNGWGNVGKFRPWITYTLQDGEDSLKMGDRQRLVALSRQVFAQSAEVEAASKQKADLTVGLGLDPLWLSDESDWSTEVIRWSKKSFFPACTPYGIAYDWKTTWKTVSMMIDRDGDILMVLRADRYGLPQIEFIHSHRIAQRFGDTEVKSGRFKGYELKDGVVYASNGTTPIGYNILGDKPEDDYVVSTANGILLFNPFCFDKGRGKPILSAALKDCFNLQDIDDYISQVVKVESAVFLVEKNKEGQAPQGRVTNPFAPQQLVDNTVATNPVSEFMFGGIRYIKPEGNVQSLTSNRPAGETMAYITRIEKRVMALLEWPHQWMLSPESMGGTMSRGIKETITRAVQARQQMLEKYASIAFQYSVARGMSVGAIPENYSIDLDNFGFTKAAELILDPGYEHSADLADYFAGLKSADEILQKWGKGYEQTLTQRDKDARKFFETLDALKKDFPQYGNIALNILGMKDAPVPPNDNQAPK